MVLPVYPTWICALLYLDMTTAFVYLLSFFSPCSPNASWSALCYWSFLCPSMVSPPLDCYIDGSTPCWYLESEPYIRSNSVLEIPSYFHFCRIKLTWIVFLNIFICCKHSVATNPVWFCFDLFYCFHLLVFCISHIFTTYLCSSNLISFLKVLKYNSSDNS